MPRGGAGYGEAGQRAIVNAWGEADYKDIMAGVDRLIAHGIADPDRLGVMGASYGGYMTNWIVTQTSRFKAASAGASLSDLCRRVLSVGRRRVHGRLFQAAVGEPRRLRGALTADLRRRSDDAAPDPARRSAIRACRSPARGSCIATLKALGKTVELDIYPRGGHVLREPMQQREQMRRNLQWFLRFIPA